MSLPTLIAPRAGRNQSWPSSPQLTEESLHSSESSEQHLPSTISGKPETFIGQVPTIQHNGISLPAVSQSGRAALQLRPYEPTTISAYASQATSNDSNSTSNDADLLDLLCKITEGSAAPGDPFEPVPIKETSSTGDPWTSLG